ncbi:MAG: Ig-like domain-containing protein [Candidatus Hydrothermarchaeales archaeon]
MDVYLPNGTYWIVAKGGATGDVRWIRSDDNPFPEEQMAYTSNSGGSWITGPVYNIDFVFEIFYKDFENTTLTSLSDGSQNVVVYANNTDGETGSDQVFFTTDTRPKITIQNPINQSYTASSVWFNVTTDLEASWCGYSLDGASNVSMTNSSGNWNNQAIVSNGKHNVKYYCNGTGGGMNASAPLTYFTADANSPDIEFIDPTPEDNSYTNVNWVLVNVSIGDTVSSITGDVVLNFNAWEYSMHKIGDGKNITAWYQVSPLSDGVKLYKVFAEDSLGNGGWSESRTITIDTTPPVISLDSPDNLTYASASLDLNYTIDENNLEWVGYSLDGSVNVTLADNITLALEDGLHSLAVYANDSAGNLNSSTVYFTIDTMLPVVTIESPLNTTYASTSVWVNVSLDDDSGNVTAQLDGTTNYSLTNSSGNWNYFLADLSEGGHNVRIFANDLAGNMNSSEAVYFIVDTPPPSVTIVLPLNETYASASLLVNVSVTDTSGVSSVLAEVNDSVNITLEKDSFTDYYNTTYTFSEGQNWIRIYANDSPGNINSTEIVYFTIDTTKPTVTILSPENTIYATQSILLNVTINEATNVTYSLNGGANISLYNSSSQGNTTITASEGSNNITVYAKDVVGNLNSSTKYFIVDTTKPAITITSPQHTIYATKNVSLNVSADETIDMWWHLLDGGANVTFEPNITLAGLSEGLHNIIAYANDSAGNVNSSFRTFIIDTVPPSLTQNIPNDSNYSTNWVYLNWTAWDAVTNLSSNLSLDGIVNASNIPTNNGTPTTYNLPGLGDGRHNWSITVWDDAGNVNSSQTRFFTVDTTPPDIEFVDPTPENNSYVNTNWVLVNTSIGDAISLVSNVLLDFELENNMYMSGDGKNLTAWYKVKSLSDGEHTYSVLAEDDLGNSAWSEMRIVNVDTTPPLLTLTSPVDETYTTASIHLNYSVSDSNLAWTGYSLDGAANITLAGNTTLTNLLDGPHSITVYANDSASNQDSALVYFTVDTTPPDIEFVDPTPENNSYTNVDWVFVNVTLQDAASLISEALLEFGGTNYPMTIAGEEKNTSAGYSITNLGDGSYEYKVFANDSIGFGAWTSMMTVNVDITPPTILLNLSNTTYGLVNISVNITITDTISNISHQWYNLDNNATNSTLYNQSYQLVNLTRLSEGNHNLQIWANDSVGSLNTTITYFTVDTISPYFINITSPVSDFNTSEVWVEFNFTALDAVASTMTANLSVDGAMNASNIPTNNGTPTTYNLTGLVEGRHNWSITVWDDAGNVNFSQTRFFTIDVTPPIIENEHATPAEATQGESIELQSDVIDALTGVASASAEVEKPDGSTEEYILQITNGSTWKIDINASDTMQIGKYTVRFRASDYVGNENSSSAYFTITALNHGGDPGKGSGPTSGGGGGSSGGKEETCLTERFQIVNASLLACMIDELNLNHKRFYSVDENLAPALSLTAGNTGEYPAPKDISLHMEKPIRQLDWDVYEVTAKKMLAGWSSAEKIVVARGDLEADSFSAIAYAKAVGAPLLLTKPGMLPSTTQEAIDRLNPKEIVIVGGEVAVSRLVEKELEKIAHVQRIWGRNREETAVELARSIELETVIRAIVIADGRKPSIEAALVSASYDAPILYVSGTKVSEVTKEFLLEHNATKDTRKEPMKVVFAGISDEARKEIEELMKIE